MEVSSSESFSYESFHITARNFSEFIMFINQTPGPGSYDI